MRGSSKDYSHLGGYVVFSRTCVLDDGDSYIVESINRYIVHPQKERNTTEKCQAILKFYEVL